MNKLKIGLGLSVVLLVAFVASGLWYYRILQNQISTLSDEKKALQTQMSAFQIDKVNLQNQIVTLTDDKTTLQSCLNQLEVEKANLQNKIDILNVQITSKETHIANLQSQISLLDTQAIDLTNERNSLQIQVSQLQTEQANLQTTINAVNVQIKSKDAQIGTLHDQISSLQETHDEYVEAYQKLRTAVNNRSTQEDVSSFITPQDYQVVSIVNTITGGWSNTSDIDEFWTDVKALYNWIKSNIDYRYDGLSPVLLFNPENKPHYTAEMWQFPNETIDLKRGDCEDQATLLCSMIRYYGAGFCNAQCVKITGSTIGHVGVQIPVSDGTLVIFDPTGKYYSKNVLGNIVYNDITLEINNWLNYWKPTLGNDVRVERVFSDSIDKTFNSTIEYILWMHI